MELPNMITPNRKLCLPHPPFYLFFQVDGFLYEEEISAFL